MINILVIYTDGTDREFEFDNLDDVNFFIFNEGDHVLDYKVLDNNTET